MSGDIFNKRQGRHPILAEPIMLYHILCYVDAQQSTQTL